MKIINPSVEEIKQESGLKGIYKAIEIAGRTCYASLDKICEGSAEIMYNNLVKNKHYSPLEFGTVYLVVPDYNYRDTEGKALEGQYIKLKYNKFTKCNIETCHYEDIEFNCAFITTNMRVIVENGLEDIMKKYRVDYPSQYHEKRRFFILTEDRGVMAEFTRHRAMSHCIQSTRYCNYSQDKYGNEITVIKPCFYEENTSEYGFWKDGCQYSEYIYMRLLREGSTPEKARSILPNSLKTIHCICGFESDWKHFLELRCSEKAHPQARELAEKINDILKFI